MSWWRKSGDKIAVDPATDDGMGDALAGFDEERAIRMLWTVGVYLTTALILGAVYWTFGARLIAGSLLGLALALSAIHYSIARAESRLEDLSRRPPQDPAQELGRSPHYIPELDPTSPHRTRSAGQRALWFSLGSGFFFGFLASGFAFANLAPFWHMALSASVIAFSPFFILFFV